jgi:DNA-directed RNA polymerase subunit omega
MSRPSVDDMLAGKTSRYALVIAVAKRAREISSEAEANEEILLEKPVNLAIRDFVNHKYIIDEPDRND